MNNNNNGEIIELERKILAIESKVLVEMAHLQTTVTEMKNALQTYVTLDRHRPVEYIAYGLAGGVLTTALGALMSQVLLK